MAIGLGIVLIVLGLILVLEAVTIDVPGIDEPTLGWILLLVGILGIVISLVVNQQRTKSTVVEERRYDAPPPR